MLPQRPGSTPRRTSQKAAVLDVVGICATLAVLSAASPPAADPGSAVPTQLHLLLTLLAVAGTIGAAIAISFTGRIDDDPAALRLGSGLMVYGGILLPITAARFATSVGAVGTVMDLLCFVSVAVLFALGLSRRGDPALAWPSAAVALVISLGIVGAAAVRPQLIPPGAFFPAAFGVVLLVTGVAAIMFIGQGLARDNVLLRRSGLGIALLVVADADRAAVVDGESVSSPTNATLRLVAVAVILAGAFPHLRSTLRRQRALDIDSAIRLRAAEESSRDAERNAADRAHELRNVVLGLSGAAALLTDTGPAGDDVERAEVGAAVSAELQRLRVMLDRPLGHAAQCQSRAFDVGPVLRTAAAVNRAAGMHIDAEIPAVLTAFGSPDDLLQVVTNLLGNCARHAPGARVRIRAATAGGRVSIEVSDDGPGIDPGLGVAVLQRGRRSSTTGGSGLGLSISQALMQRNGGELRLVATAADEPGCRVALCLPSPITIALRTPPRGAAQLAG